MENENFEKNIREYLYFAEFGENKSQNTILSLKKDLFQFSKYLLEIEKTESAKEVSSVMIRGFILFLQENGNSKRTINRKLSSLRSFFKYLVRNNIVYQNPAEIVASPSFSVEKPDVLTIEEINSLREVISLKTANGIRDRLMLELLYSSGITTVELLSVGEGVFDLDKRELYVTNGKNNRIVFFSERVRKYFKDYVEAKKKKYKEKYNPDILFVNGSGNRLSDRSLRRIIDRYAKKAGIEREISPYSFRHTFAVHMLFHGMDVLYVKELMGHVNIESTKLYEQMISGVTLNL